MNELAIRLKSCSSATFVRVSSSRPYAALHEIARILQEEEVIDGETVARFAGGAATESSAS